MITNTMAPSVGNALRLFITPPAGAVYWRVLRRTADAFVGATDAGAVVVADECTDNAVLDVTGLVNGTPYYYRDYAWNGLAWLDPGQSASATPSTSYTGETIDPQGIVRERVSLGMAAEVSAGRLKPTTGTIPVFTAPFAMAEHLTFPAVSVHMDATSPGARFIGEVLAPDDADLSSGIITETEGWLARMTLTVSGVSLNPDERIALRLALRRVVLANLPIFDHNGKVEIEFSQNDTEEFSENNAPLYFTRGTLTFLAPAFVQDTVAPIVSVTVAVTAP